MNVTINRQPLGLEDLAWGTGTQTQTRGGVTGTITEINAGNLPFDETQTLLEVYDILLPVKTDLDIVVANLPEILLADDNAAIATTKASEAVDSAADALNSAEIALGAKDDVIAGLIDDNSVTSTNTYSAEKIEDSIQVVPLKVKAQVAISKGQAVMYHGYSDSEDAMKVKPTILQSDICVGIATEDIPIDTFGKVAVRGLVTPMNTSTWSVGQILYSNGSGGYTTTKPTAAYQAVAYVLRSNATTGALMVAVNEPVKTMQEIDTYLGSQITGVLI